MRSHKACFHLRYRLIPATYEVEFIVVNKDNPEDEMLKTKFYLQENYPSVLYKHWSKEGRRKEYVWEYYADNDIALPEGYPDEDEDVDEDLMIMEQTHLRNSTVPGQ
ncbi:hypothetical protein NW768_006789 [Fusarium equiseti]|uniref:Chromo domain-containing protein n=1 Tax=Fusarium equiseti TaxID=61235 RepID=A0ABQ8R9D3_FUSEQ|nr:hypothetical protein NW768_006789 [Fusarium equiseti]